MTNFYDQPKPMGLAEVKLRRGSQVIALGVTQEVSVTDMVVSGTLRGSGEIAAVNTYIEGAEVKFGVGGLPIAALPIIYGMTLPAAAGIAPNRSMTISIPSNSGLPYFELKGRSLGDGGDCVHIYLPKVKLTKGFTITFKDGAEWTAPQMEAIALPQDGRPYDVISHETNVAVAFTTLTLTDIDVASNIATATTAAAHGISAGETWVIAGAAASFINGVKQIISTPSNTTFTFIAVGADTTNDTGTASR